MFLCSTSSPHRLVVRTSRCGRDNPGSNPGVDNLMGWQCCLGLAGCCLLPARWLCARSHPASTVPGIEVWCLSADSTVRHRRGAWQRPAAADRPLLPVTHANRRIPLQIVLHLKSTSSSGQDVASWPRQPRFKSWCGQFGGVAMLPWPCRLLPVACPLALRPIPPRIHHAWHRGVVP